MKGEIPDWVRLQKALSVEAEKGYPDLQGNQYRFSEFLCLSFGDNPPVGISTSERNRWRELAQKFAQYSQFNPRQRQQLVAETRNFLQQLRQTLEATPTPKEPAAAKIINTIPITAKANSPRQVTLEQPLKYLAEVGERKASLLERLNLHKVEDLLYYYPRDHVDYSRQVNIANLTEGETVTLVGNVKRCNCFNSPKNTKLTIFELLLQDRTGQIKLNRFYAGTHYTNRAWQEGQKKLYPVGSVVAVSGLVKAGKYGLTLENPEFELLDSSGASIESLKIGRILPVYPLTDGVPADLIRKAVVAAFGAVEAIKDPLPFGLKKQYGLIDLKTAITNIHFPNNSEILSQARRRLVFDEFFFLQLGFLRRRQQYRQTQKSAVFSAKGQLIDQFNQIIPFQLTNAQKRVIEMCC